MVKLLLAHGADPLRPGPRRETPLDLARRKGHAAIVEALERAG